MQALQYHRLFLPLAPLVAVVLLAGRAFPDTITLADGKVLENVTVVTEGLKELTYKQDGKSKTVASDTVVAVEFKKKPKLVDQADTTAREGDILGAIGIFETYVGGLINGNGKESMQWALPYALQRLVDLNGSLGDGEAVLEAADLLIANGRDSRYLPGAYLSKATVLYDTKRQKEALAVIGELRKVIETQTLGRRWELEADLAAALSDPALGAAKRRAKVIEISGAAGKDYPMVANRAKVAEGESYIEGETKEFGKAMAVFQQIVGDPTSDAATLAGAYVGLGDCVFAKAIEMQKANQDANPTFLEAVESYMRVVVLFPEQVRYRSKAMFLSGRALEFLGDDTSRGRARGLYRSVMREYKESTWAEEARKQLGG